jgi:hypothetical protein
MLGDIAMLDYILSVLGYLVWLERTA